MPEFEGLLACFAIDPVRSLKIGVDFQIEKRWQGTFIIRDDIPGFFDTIENRECSRESAFHLGHGGTSKFFLIELAQRLIVIHPFRHEAQEGVAQRIEGVSDHMPKE